ncbi:ribosomal subunit Interface protein [Acidovorax carolinensis]|jgi:ribosome-associated translation inhibitor RaiA|uniref:Ribosomal subunit Interface protein n=1 Tax=Acidovorax carolinensis TaxID=553814 RepID=A0A240U766_9BURK|nr:MULTISPECIES: HPF/RaiA family ribosome-associated protein [Acidovorax]ART53247.1 ribosomal subunit Interface protein [Acidovorax carolinensis]MBP3979171.1 HPF/RaiA family ribosome-associated protein [Acidovorax sp. JG5]
MQVQVHTDDHIHGGESLAQWIQDEAGTRLARFREHITRLEVFLTDLDAGKSGAEDKRCRIEARVANRQPVTVTADADKMATAFVSAVDKLTRALDTDLGRVKDRHGRDTIRDAQE